MKGVMSCSISKNANLNYVASIVKVDNFATHPFADKLKLATVNGCTISVSIDTEPGLFIYFPLESQLSSMFLSRNNLYRKSLNLNVDPEANGFFEATGRVKCVKLRQVYSEGFLMPIKSITETYDGVMNLSCMEVGTKFDTIHFGEESDLICQKYVIQTSTPGSYMKGPKCSKKYEDKIVPNQFRFHPDTGKLKENLHLLSKDEYIHLSYKIHGTSAIFCNLLVNRELKWWENLLMRFGVKIQTDEYHDFCASRKVVKDPDINRNLNSGFYDVDIWNLGLEIMHPHLTKGMTIYAEIAGYLPNGKMIQKGYDYGCVYDSNINYSNMTGNEMYMKNLFKIFVYRITYTSVDGKVMEMSATDLQQFCKRVGLIAVPELWFGKISEWLPNTDSSDWALDFVTVLSNKYLEGDCWLCNNKVPAEGIVLRTMKPAFEALKLKSLRFSERETKELDAGITNIEDNQ